LPTNRIVRTNMETVYAAELGWTTDLVGYNKLFSWLVTILSWLNQMIQLSGARKLSDEKDCCGCSIFSWEKKKFDNFNKLFFSDTLYGTDYEQHWLVPPVCNGGVECKMCGHFLCHDRVCAFHKANKDGPSRSPGFVAGSHHAFITRTCHSNFSGPLLYYEGEGSETVHGITLALC
jgi:hypothetical protein